MFVITLEGLFYYQSALKHKVKINNYSETPKDAKILREQSRSKHLDIGHFR
jgi:hypothetical protein